MFVVRSGEPLLSEPAPVATLLSVALVGALIPLRIIALFESPCGSWQSTHFGVNDQTPISVLACAMSWLLSLIAPVAAYVTPDRSAAVPWHLRHSPFVLSAQAPTAPPAFCPV